MPLAAAALLLLPTTGVFEAPTGVALAVAHAPQSQADAAEEAARLVAGLAERGLHAQVIREAREFFLKHPRSPRADGVRYRLAEALFQTGRFAEAREEFARLATKGAFELPMEVQFRLGECALELGEPAQAVPCFERVLAGDAEYLAPAAGYLIGEAHSRAGDPARAELAWLALLERPDAAAHAADARYGLVWCARDLGRAEDVLTRCAAFERAEAGDDRLSEVRLLHGETLLALGRADEALALLERVPDGPDRPAAQRAAGAALFELGRFEQAAQAFDAIVAADTEGDLSHDARTRAAVAWLRAGRAERALERLENLPGRPDAERWLWIGLSQRVLGDHTASLEALDRALAMDLAGELAREAHAARGDALDGLGRASEAAGAYEMSGDAYGLHAAAIAAANAGEFERALELAERQLATFPGSSFAPAMETSRAECLFQLQRFEDASRVFRVLAARAEEAGDTAARSAALSRVAWCAYSSGDLAAAEQGFGEVARTTADPAERNDALLLCGECARARGDREAAAGHFEAFLEAATDDPRRARAWLELSETTDGERSERALERLLAEPAAGELAQDARFALAERLRARGASEGALVHYRAVDDARFAEAAAWGLAWCELDQGRPDAARAALAPLVTGRAREGTSEQGRRAAFELLVWVESARGDGAAAGEAARAFATLESDPARTFAAAREAGSALLASGEPARAAKLFADLGGLAGDASLPFDTERVHALLAAGEVDAADELVRRLGGTHARDSGVREALFFVGEAHYGAGDTTRAASVYDAAAGRSEDADSLRERALYKGAYAHLSRDAWQPARERLGRLVAEFPKGELAGESLYLLGEACYRLDDDEAAALALERVLTEHPRHDVRPKALFRLGLARGRLADWKGSLEALEELLAKHETFPQRSEADLARGRAHAALGQGRAARQAFDQVLVRETGVLAARARIERGKLDEQDGELEVALAEYLKVAVLFEGSEEGAEATLRAGGVLEAQGEGSAARARYRELVAGYPDSPFAQEASRRLATLGSQ